jgi:hypothetical protein
MLCNLEVVYATARHAERPAATLHAPDRVRIAFDRMPPGGDALALEQPHHVCHTRAHCGVFDAFDAVGQNLDWGPSEIFRHRRAVIAEPRHRAERVIPVLRPEVERAHRASMAYTRSSGPRCNPSRAFPASLNIRDSLYASTLLLWAIG